MIFLLLPYTALIFLLGLLAGRGKKKGKPKEPQYDINTEIINFLNYDGSNQ